MESSETPGTPRSIHFDPPGDYPQLVDLLRKIKKERQRNLFVLGSNRIGYGTTDQLYTWKKEIREAAQGGPGHSDRLAWWKP